MEEWEFPSVSWPCLSGTEAPGGCVDALSTLVQKRKRRSVATMQCGSYSAPRSALDSGSLTCSLIAAVGG
ncbi:uncharacterized protein [Physcomitrium patens]|uniref:uncharacterized protein isoform X4 n=1 Tax=Physcomitrium patens TaxID=3218 RepID=UPI003CCE4A51